jgi:hypothetical protein
VTNLRTTVTALAAGALLLAACSSDDPTTSAEAPETAGEALLVSVASYELEASSPQRFLVGVESGDQSLIGYGTAQVTFAYTGTRDDPIEDPKPLQPMTATYRLIPGQRPQGDTSRPRPVEFDQGAGVYGVDDATFDEPGFWAVEVEIELDGAALRGTAAFEVLEDSTLPEVGDPAPRTVNHLPGAPGVPPAGIDSRAEDADVPDPELHDSTVADALAAGRPLVVVVSTPVYCVSRFCGPITDSVQELARRFEGDVDFVHLEVWRDFENRVINKAATEWIFPAGGADGAREPWVFTVDRSGTIERRFDNVVSDEELEAAVQELVG